MSAQFTITFQAGDIKSLNLKDIGARRFVRLYDNSRGILQGTICTGTQWDAGYELPSGEHTSNRPVFASYVLKEVGLTLFDPHDEQDLFLVSPVYFLAVIEFEIDGKVGYLLRVREITDESYKDPAFTNQYRINTKGSDNPANWKAEDADASIAYALDRYLFRDDEAGGVVWTFPDAERAAQAGRIARPTLAEYADEVNA